MDGRTENEKLLYKGEGGRLLSAYLKVKESYSDEERGGQGWFIVVVLVGQCRLDDDRSSI